MPCGKEIGQLPVPPLFAGVFAFGHGRVKQEDADDAPASLVVLLGQFVHVPIIVVVKP